MATLTAAELAATRIKVDKINARAQRRGFTGRLDLAAERRIIANVPNDRGHLPFPDLREGIEVTVFDVTITGEAPSYGGWEFLARVVSHKSADGDALWEVRCAPGVNDSEIDRAMLTVGWCDHCQRQIASRKNLFLVRHSETGQWRQVGATCIKDFLGWSALPVFLSADEVEMVRDARFVPTVSPVSVLAIALASTSLWGFRPASFGQQTTVDAVSRFLFPPGRTTDADRAEATALADELATPDKDYYQEAERLIGFVKENATAAYGFEANLRAVVLAADVETKNFALLVSAVKFRERALEDSAAEEEREQRPDPVHLGSVDEKVEIHGTVTLAMQVDGYAYGTTQMLVVVRTETALIKFYSSAGWVYDLEVGDETSFTATVKKHEDYQGQQQTVVKAPRRLAV